MDWLRLRSGMRALGQRLGGLLGGGGGPVATDGQSPEPDQHFLRELAASIDQVLLLWDLRAGRLLYVSPALEPLTGIAPDDTAGLAARLSGLVYPEDRVRLSGQVRALRDDETFKTEFRIDRADGAIRWIRARGFPVRDSAGAVYRRAVLAQDITSDRQAREQLTVERTAIETRIDERAAGMTRLLEEARRNEARFNEAQHIARVGSWELDLVTNRLLWSDEIFRIFEIDPYGFGASYEAFLEAIHPDDRDVVNRAYTESVRNRTPYEIVHRLRMPDGRVKHVRERCETSYAADGRPLRSAGTVQDITAQVQAQQERDRAQALLTTIMDSSPDWIYVKDREHRFLMVNRSCAAVVGRSPEELIGRRDTDFWPRELCEGDPQRGIRGFHEDDRLAFAGKLIHNPEVPALMEEGDARIFDTYKCPLRDASGEIYGVLGYSRDVTERRRAERTLRSSTVTLEQHVAARTAELEAARNFTETLLDIVGALVVVLDRDGRIVRFNRACEAVTGYAAAEALGRCVWDFLLLPDEREPVRNVFGTLRARKFPETYENAWLTRDGRQRHIAWSNTVMTNAAGDVEYLVGTGIDITERKRAEQALAESEAMLREVAENISEVFWLVSPDRRTMHYVSPAFRQVWGRPCSDLYANPKIVFDMIHPEDRDRIMAETLPQLRGEFRDAYDQEYRIIRPDGETRWLHVRYHPIRDESGAVRRIAGVGEDVTERKRSEQARLQQAREQRDTLVREVHHRIKNNLQGVVGLLRQHAGEHPQTALPLEMAIARIQSMALVFGLRSHASTESVLLCRMTEAIARSIADLTGAAIEPRVELRGPCPVPVAEGEAVPVALILNELVFNAVKHQAGESGRRPVTVDIHYMDQHATVTIVTPAARLPPGFDFAAGRGLGSGLQLVRSLLPRPAADLVLRDSDAGVVAELTLLPPVIMGLAEAVQLMTNERRVADVTG